MCIIIIIFKDALNNASSTKLGLDFIEKDIKFNISDKKNSNARALKN